MNFVVAFFPTAQKIVVFTLDWSGAGVRGPGQGRDTRDCGTMEPAELRLSLRPGLPGDVQRPERRADRARGRLVPDLHCHTQAEVGRAGHPDFHTSRARWRQQSAPAGSILNFSGAFEVRTGGAVKSPFAPGA